MDNNQKAFFELLRAGLFPDHGEGVMVHDTLFMDVNWGKVYQIAQEQSVQGVVLQGIEELRAKNIELSVPKVLLLQWIGEVQLIEQRNKEMNIFLARLIEDLKSEGIRCALVKGQGIAQCYERPLWRSSGDIDLLLDEENYFKASSYLPNRADQVKENRMDIKHFEMSFGTWVVELHGTLHGEWSRRVDRVIDDLQVDSFRKNNFRIWKNNNVEALLPSPDVDVLFVFSHILQHFFIGGIGLRQICDWCRLLWTFRTSLNQELLESRIREAGLMSEWKAFGAFAVVYLGMPVGAIPLYSDDSRWKRKASRLLDFVMETGNFGHNRDESYKMKYPVVIRLFISFWRRVKDTYKHFCIFPLDALKAWMTIWVMGVRFVIKKFN